MASGFYRGCYVTFENIEAEGELRHMRAVLREKAIEMCNHSHTGRRGGREHWRSGFLRHLQPNGAGGIQIAQRKKVERLG
jgi:hypothetical protein